MARRTDRLTGLTGVAYAVVGMAGWGLARTGSPGEWLAPGGDLVRYYERHHDDVLIGTTLVTLSVFLLLWFIGAASAALRRAEGPEGRLSSIALGGGAVGAALFLAGHLMRAVPAFRADQDGTVAQTMVVALGDTGDYLAGAGAPLGFGVLVAATAVAGFRHAVLPRWLSWTSAALAAALVLPVIPWLAIMVFPLWVAAAGVAVQRRQPAEAAAPVATGDESAPATASALPVGH